MIATFFVQFSLQFRRLLSHTATIMLEDDFTWVIRKAFKGLALAPGEAASRAGLSEQVALAFSRGNFSADTARRIAPVLGLNPEALANHPHYF